MTTEEKLKKCEAAVSNLIVALGVLTKTVSELTEKVSEMDGRLGKCKGMEIARQIRETEIKSVGYDADECCASCRYLRRDKGAWKCVLNNLERDIVDPARRHCLGYEEVRKEQRKEEKKCENCANCSPWDGYCGLGNNEEARDRGVCERWESK